MVEFQGVCRKGNLNSTEFSTGEHSSFNQCDPDGNPRFHRNGFATQQAWTITPFAYRAQFTACSQRGQRYLPVGQNRTDLNYRIDDNLFLPLGIRIMALVMYGKHREAEL